jgi:hypothetical protein
VHNDNRNVSLRRALINQVCLQANPGQPRRECHPAIGSKNQIHVLPDWRGCVNLRYALRNQIHVLADVRQCQSPVGSKKIQIHVQPDPVRPRDHISISQTPTNSSYIHIHSYKLGLQSCHHLKNLKTSCAYQLSVVSPKLYIQFSIPRVLPFVTHRLV